MPPLTTAAPNSRTKSSWSTSRGLIRPPWVTSSAAMTSAIASTTPCATASRSPRSAIRSPAAVATRQQRRQGQPPADRGQRRAGSAPARPPARTSQPPARRARGAPRRHRRRRPLRPGRTKAAQPRGRSAWGVTPPVSGTPPVPRWISTTSRRGIGPPGRSPDPDLGWRHVGLRAHRPVLRGRRVGPGPAGVHRVRRRRPLGGPPARAADAAQDAPAAGPGAGGRGAARGHPRPARPRPLGPPRGPARLLHDRLRRAGRGAARPPGGRPRRSSAVRRSARTSRSRSPTWRRSGCAGCWSRCRSWTTPWRPASSPSRR